MVHIAIENLLSTCKNRSLYEALWFFSFTKSKLPEILENESISTICNKLMDRVRDEDVDARSFVVSANLVFGTVRLYKLQIDKLYDQAKFALQSCRTTFYQINWLEEMTQMTSTPVPKSSKKTRKNSQKTQKQAKAKSSVKKVVESKKILDDFDMIESVFESIDQELQELDDDTLVPESNRRGKKGAKNDSGIDPTMALNVFSITMREPSTLMTTGYHTMINNDEFDNFDSYPGDDLQSLLKDTEDAVNSQSKLIQTTSNLLTTTKSSLKRHSTSKNDSKVKKRRLTYMSYEDTIDEPRNAVDNDQIQDFDIYEQPPLINDSSTLKEASKMEIPTLIDDFADGCQSIMQSSLKFQPMEVDNESLSFDLPTFDEPTLQNTLEASNHDEPMITEDPVAPVEPQIITQESEFALEDILRIQTKQKRSKKLMVDKKKFLLTDTVRKSIVLYKDTLTRVAPFQDFLQRMHYFKSCTDVLFSTGSSRLRKSELQYLYTRNMKKISEKLAKKKPRNVQELMQNLEMDEIVSPQENVVKRSARQKSIKIPDLDVDLENISPLGDASAVETKKKSGKVLQESNLNQYDDIMDELALLPLELSMNMAEKQPELLDFDLPPAIEQCANANAEIEENTDYRRASRKRAVLTKLKHFWKRQDQSITMDKLCIGMQRSEAASTFFELLLLAKYRIIELVHETESLEISNILCNISSTQLSKELKKLSI